MINKDLIRNRIDLINRSIARLKRMAALSIAEHHLRRALQSLFDAGRHIIAKQGLGHPVDYRSIILTLGREKIIPPQFAERIKGMAGYRNRLVHGYAEVTPEEMYNVIQERLDDFEEFCFHILKYTANT